MRNKIRSASNKSARFQSRVAGGGAGVKFKFSSFHFGEVKVEKKVVIPRGFSNTGDELVELFEKALMNGLPDTFKGHVDIEMESYEDRAECADCPAVLTVGKYGDQLTSAFSSLQSLGRHLENDWMFDPGDVIVIGLTADVYQFSRDVYGRGWTRAAFDGNLDIHEVLLSIFVYAESEGKRLAYDGEDIEIDNDAMLDIPEAVSAYAGLDSYEDEEY